MATTNLLGITLLEQAQAQKEVTINQAFSALDAAMTHTVLDKDLATPPGSPAVGDRYIVAASATGAWAGKTNQIAFYDQGWRFIAPSAGYSVWVNDESQTYRYSGSAWVLAPRVAAYGTGTIAASSSSVVISNAACSATSLVFASLRTNDATALIKNVVPGAGSFTITLNAAATASASVGYCIIN